MRSLPLDDLHFDPENPRIPSSVDTTDEEELLAWMLSDANLLNLMRSIGTHGYFTGEPLLVVPEGDQDEFRVVEGNRRLAALRLLENPELAPRSRSRVVTSIASEASHRPTKIPCVEFAQRDDLMGHLGYRHITGIQEWSPLAKARYLRQLWDRLGGDAASRRSELASRIGTNADYVARLLTALALFNRIEREDFYDIEGLAEETISFSLLVLALNYGSVVKYLGLESPRDQELIRLNTRHLEHLARWLFEEDESGSTKLRDSRNMKLLNAVLSHDEATAALESGDSLRDAVEQSAHPRQVFATALTRARDRLTAAASLASRIEDPGELEFSLLDEIDDNASSIRRRLTQTAESSTPADGD